MQRITDAELEVMKVLWEVDSPRTVAEIRSALFETIGWKATTVKTLLYNLRDKGAVSEVKRGVYRPAVRESDVAWEFIRKLFGGSANKLIASLIDSDGMSESEISELRSMLAGGEGDD